MFLVQLPKIYLENTKFSEIYFTHWKYTQIGYVPILPAPLEGTLGVIQFEITRKCYLLGEFYLLICVSHPKCTNAHSVQNMTIRRPGMKSLQKIVQMAFFSTSKQPCQSYSTKVTDDDVGGWKIWILSLGSKISECCPKMSNFTKKLGKNSIFQNI